MTESFISYNKYGAVSFVGEPAVRVFQAATIVTGLRFYAKTGMKPSRAFTPMAMMDAAKRITGHDYKRRDYLGAADDLEKWLHEAKAALPTKET